MRRVRAPTEERTLDPARMFGEELDPQPGIREQPGSPTDQVDGSPSLKPCSLAPPSTDTSTFGRIVRSAQLGSWDRGRRPCGCIGGVAPPLASAEGSV